LRLGRVAELRTQPRNMLIARATAEVARLIAADAILGIPYVTEELEDADVMPVATQREPEAAAPRTARRRKRRATLAPEGTPPDPPPFDEGLWPTTNHPSMN
jgi:hypothetical protein